MSVQYTTETANGFIPLAWMDWSLCVPADWRPLRLTGEWARGAAMVGDGQRGMFQVKWWRPRTRRFVPQKWIERRLRREAGNGAEPVKGPRPDGFVHTVWLPADPAGTRRRALWYGFHEAANLMLELVVDGTVPDVAQQAIEQQVLPSLSAAPPDSPRPHALFGARFVAPPGYRVDAWKLMLGDISLKMTGQDRRTGMMVRQVYPAELALSRRALGHWLVDRPFKEHRHFNTNGDSEEFVVTMKDGDLRGLCRSGSKRLPFPLGPVGALCSMAGIVHDEQRNRLFLAELDTPRPAARQAIGDAIRNMDVVSFPQAGRST